ncbi:neuronal acetylcholine receptor subunit alpha-10-like [Xenia sp. Carnegie-2017]|uniref:neuronal acetylcholine receptor subunit alpha-10-like n=1 Tax=Xenia sp. Carnegie-2017 TaxID=2897299 RepID=UPI001F043EF5|nr:neuronal acetylcholine receptor subunit alpha-10-like [Xenia sp. Carnegie-2017]
MLCKSCMIIVFTKHFLSPGSKDTKDYEFLLRKNLFKNYSSKSLPSLNKTTPVRVKVGTTLRQILDVDEKHQVMVTSIWFRLYWKDETLSWNPLHYKNVKELHIDDKDIWVPDISIYNTASDEDILYKRLDTDIVLKQNGEASWLAPVLAKTECKIDVKYFPFDDQMCRITFGSWINHGLQVDVSNSTAHADIDNYVENTEWDLLSAYFTRLEKVYSCCSEPYPSVTLNIHIRRRALFYLFNLVIPCAVIAILAALAFCLPSNNGERISLVVTVLLSLTVYMLIVSENMPPTSEVVPLIGKFYISTMVLIALTLAAVCVTLNCYEREKRMSSWLKKLLIDILAKVLCFEQKIVKKINPAGFYVNHSFNVCNMTLEKTSTADDGKKNNNMLGTSSDDSNEHTKVIEINSLKSGAKRFEDVVLQQKIITKHENNEIKGQWKMACKVLDRLFFLVFLASFFAMTIVVFLEAPTVLLT